MTTNYYSTTSSNGAPVFAVPVQTTANQVPVLPPSYSMAVASDESDCYCDCSFNRRNAVWLSVMLIVAGLIGIIGTAMGLYTKAHLAEIGTGLWCGLMFLATGSVAIAAGQNRTIHLMRATVATSVVTLVFAVAELILGTFGLFDVCYECYGYDWEIMEISSSSLLMASASFAFFFALWLLIIASISLRSMSNSLVPGAQTVDSVVMTTSPPSQMASSSQPQQIVIFNNYNQPTGQLGQDGTPLPQDQPFVILGQQAQPVFRQEGTTFSLNPLSTGFSP